MRWDHHVVPTSRQITNKINPKNSSQNCHNLLLSGQQQNDSFTACMTCNGSLPIRCSACTHDFNWLREVQWGPGYWTSSRNRLRQYLDLLVDSGKSLSVAESCTGGMIASQLISFSGSYIQLMKRIAVWWTNNSLMLLRMIDTWGSYSTTLVNPIPLSLLCEAEYFDRTSMILRLIFFIP